MTGLVADVVVIVLLVVIVGSSLMYIKKQKKKGVRCIGCPAAGTCSRACACGAASSKKESFWAKLMKTFRAGKNKQAQL